MRLWKLNIENRAHCGLLAYPRGLAPPRDPLSPRRGSSCGSPSRARPGACFPRLRLRLGVRRAFLKAHWPPPRTPCVRLREALKHGWRPVRGLAPLPTMWHVRPTWVGGACRSSAFVVQRVRAPHVMAHCSGGGRRARDRPNRAPVASARLTGDAPENRRALRLSNVTRILMCAAGPPCHCVTVSLRDPDGVGGELETFRAARLC